MKNKQTDFLLVFIQNYDRNSERENFCQCKPRRWSKRIPFNILSTEIQMKFPSGFEENTWQNSLWIDNKNCSKCSPDFKREFLPKFWEHYALNWAFLTEFRDKFWLNSERVPVENKIKTVNIFKCNFFRNLVETSSRIQRKFLPEFKEKWLQ